MLGIATVNIIVITCYEYICCCCCCCDFLLKTEDCIVIHIVEQNRKKLRDHVKWRIKAEIIIEKYKLNYVHSKEYSKYDRAKNKSVLNVSLKAS